MQTLVGVNRTFQKRCTVRTDIYIYIYRERERELKVFVLSVRLDDTYIYLDWIDVYPSPWCPTVRINCEIKEVVEITFLGFQTVHLMAVWWRYLCSIWNDAAKSNSLSLSLFSPASTKRSTHECVHFSTGSSIHNKPHCIQRTVPCFNVSFHTTISSCDGEFGTQIRLIYVFNTKAHSIQFSQTLEWLKYLNLAIWKM